MKTEIENWKEMIMKKLYIQPTSNVQNISSINTICVGSVHGNSGVKYGGGVNSNTSGVRPM